MTITLHYVCVCVAGVNHDLFTFPVRADPGDDACISDVIVFVSDVITSVSDVMPYYLQG